MSINSEALDPNLAIHHIVATDGNMPLAAERLKRVLQRNVTEYELTAAISSAPDAAKRLSDSFRISLTVRLFDFINTLGSDVLGCLDEMKPSDKARMYSSMMTAFVALTAPTAKTTFDFDAEVMKMVDEFDISREEAEESLRQTLAESRKRVKM